MFDECREYLEEIEQHLNEALKYFRDLHVALFELEDAGMYPAVPTEEWQGQDGSGGRLYLHFPDKPGGTYRGPDGQQAIYIGTDLEQIAEAWRLAENRRRHEQLSAATWDLDDWLFRYEHQLQVLALIAKYWPRKTEVLGPFVGDGGSKQERKRVPFSRRVRDRSIDH